jgi:ATP-dependent DNA ligase
LTSSFAAERSLQHFCAFDLLSLDGEDLRGEPLIERRRLLKALVPPQTCRSCMSITSRKPAECSSNTAAVSTSRVSSRNTNTPAETDGPFTVGREKTAWAKIRNPNYSKREGWGELFQKRARLRL